MRESRESKATKMTGEEIVEAVEKLRKSTENLLDHSKETIKTAKHSLGAAIVCAIFAGLSLVISIIALIRCNC